MSYSIVIGVDESGRGALAGPLTVCAAAFRREDVAPTAEYISTRGQHILQVRDSKKVTKPEHREALARSIRKHALAVSLVERSAEEIDAKLMFSVFPDALREAVSKVLIDLYDKGYAQNPADYLACFDGEVPLPRGLRCMSRAIPGGDATVWQIGAASLVAKVACDEVMMRLHEQYPVYNFAKHKGYPTVEHKRALKEHGASNAHRRSYRPVAECQGLPPGFEF